MSYVKNPAISISRILGMLSVVLCHTIMYYTFIPGSDFLGQFFGVGVHLFFFVSGYLYGGKTVTSFRTWYATRFLTVSFPAMLVSIVVMTLLLIFGIAVSANTFVVYALDLEGILFLNSKVLSFFDETAPLGHLWFTTIIMFCYLLIPVLQKVPFSSSRKTHTPFIVTLLLVGIGVCYITFSFFNMTFFFLFVIAYFLGKARFLNNIRFKFLLTYTLVFVTAIIVRLILRQYIDGTSLYSFYVAISNYVLGTWPVFMLAYLHHKFPKFIHAIAEHRITKWLDNYSFYIYLSHALFCDKKILNLYGTHPLWLATIIFCASTIFTAIITKWICDALTKPLLTKLKA